ncbi:hypothetical protein ACOSQ3_028691 [Xanthoceras sorbifolium]
METDEIIRVCERLSLSEEDGPVARVDQSLQKRGLKSVSMCLFGKILVNREINRDAFRSAISRIWKTTKKVEVEAIGMNIFAFRFKCDWDRKRILEGGPWCFDKNLLILCEAKGIGKIYESDFQFSPMWIQLHNLPLACMSREVGLFLGEMIGEVLEVDPGSSGDCLGKFIRVRALVDVGKPFRRVLRVIIGEPEVECVVILKFERMPNFCYFCGRAGHLVRECSENVNSIVDESLLKFGSWMRAIGPSFNRSRGRESRTDTDEGGNGKENSDPNPIKKDNDACRPSTISSPLKNKNAGGGAGAAKRQEFSVVVPLPIDEVSCVIAPNNCVSAGILSSDISSLGSLLSRVESFSQDVDSRRSTVNDGGEVSSSRGRRWKRLAREKVAVLNTVSSLSELGKRDSELNMEDYQGKKQRLGSDHSPLLISGVNKSVASRDGLGKWSSRFHFEETWTREDNCKSIVEEAWNSVSCRDAVRGVKSSSDTVASRLISWSNAIKKERNAEFKRLLAHGAPNISHLLFADDSLIFVRADSEECRVLKDILAEYEMVSVKRCVLHQRNLSLVERRRFGPKHWSKTTPFWLRKKNKNKTVSPCTARPVPSRPRSC